MDAQSELCLPVYVDDDIPLDDDTVVEVCLNDVLT